MPDDWDMSEGLGRIAYTGVSQTFSPTSTLVSQLYAHDTLRFLDCPSFFPPRLSPAEEFQPSERNENKHRETIFSMLEKLRASSFRLAIHARMYSNAECIRVEEAARVRWRETPIFQARRLRYRKLRRRHRRLNGNAEKCQRRV